MVDSTVVILQPITNTLNQVLTYIPVIIAALIILLIGWIIGRIAGGVASRLFKTMRVDETIGKTGIGDALAGTGMSATSLFSAVVRWFIYLIFIMAAVSVLNIPVFTNFVNQVVLYIPNLIAGILILVVGLVGINFIMDWIKAMLQKQKVEFANIITLGLQALLSLVVIVIALDQLQIDTQIIYTFLVPLAWGIAAGLAIAIGLAVGVGGKDVAAEYLQKIAKTGETRAGEVKQKAEEAERKAGGGESEGEEEFREPGTGMGDVEREPKGKFKKL